MSQEAPAAALTAEQRTVLDDLVRNPRRRTPPGT
jgi:hypothetical protein